MRIHKATKIALRKGLLMKRKVYSFKNVLIKPTNSVDCCFVIITDSPERQPGKRWNPTADDLMANDWYVTKE